MTTYHMHIEVRGALKWPKSRLKGMFRNKETGKHLTPDEVRELLMDHLTEGHECIPCGPCDNFNHGKDGGCMGHNAKVSGAGTASAGLPGCAAKTTENK